MSDDEGLTGFLNAQTEDGEAQTFTVKGTTYTLVQTANPVNWTRVGAAIFLSGVATVSVALQNMATTWGNAVADIVSGTTSWIGSVEFVPYIVTNTDDPTDLPGEWTGSGVIGELFVPLLQWFRKDLWTSSVDQFGVFGYLVAVAFVLLVVYVVVRGLQMAGKRLAGGS